VIYQASGGSDVIYICDIPRVISEFQPFFMDVNMEVWTKANPKPSRRKTCIAIYFHLILLVILFIL